MAKIELHELPRFASEPQRKIIAYILRHPECTAYAVHEHLYQLRCPPIPSVDNVKVNISKMRNELKNSGFDIVKVRGKTGGYTLVRIKKDENASAQLPLSL